MRTRSFLLAPDHVERREMPRQSVKILHVEILYVEGNLHIYRLLEFVRCCYVF